MNHYVLVGAGGTGTHLAPALAHYLNSYHGEDNWTMSIIDGDSVEDKNLLRQIFSPMNVEQNKAAALASQLGFGRVYAMQEYLSSGNIERLIPDGSTVLIAVDNYPVRALIEKYCATLDDCNVINGGNEKDTGSCQIWVRRNGKNVTPPISFLHPEILSPGEDRSEMSCAQVAALPGGEQIIVANMASAAYMLTALIKIHTDNINWTEIHFESFTGKTFPTDYRDIPGWKD